MSFSLRLLQPPVCLFLLALGLAAIGCGGGGGGTTTVPPVTLAVSLGSETVVVPQDGAAVTVAVTVTGATGTPTVALSSLPAGITQQFTPTAGGPSGTLTLTGSSSAAAGTYASTVSVGLAGQNATQPLTVISAAVAKVADTVDSTLGVKGVLAQFMSTSFQVDEWTEGFFGTGATATARETTLTQLGPQHVRLQPISQGVPMVANTGAASDWNFTVLDETVQPVLASADHSPEFQIAVAPAWMCTSNGQLDMTNHLRDFAAFAANLVRYYNKGGFNYGGVHFQSPGSHTITWWGIFNEFNGNGLTGPQYVQLYNTVVPAMLAVDPTIKLSALEFSDYGLGTGGGGDPMVYFPPFVAPANAGGVNTQVDIVSTHFYGTCNQQNTDQNIFSQPALFAQNVSYFYQELQKRPDLANVPVWVTENNVNADYAAANGMSTCNPSQVFVDDKRGTSAFFAAWRPYVFSQLGKVGNQALYHWSFFSDPQYGEVDSNGNLYLSYWVDKALENFYPSTLASPGPQILSLNATDTSTVETLATKNSDGSVQVLVVDRAVAAANDNNGAGAPRTVVVDLSSFSNFSAASLLTIDATTSVANGPSGVGVTPAARIPVTLNGYGMAILKLTP
jgi:hypothetical protein